MDALKFLSGAFGDSFLELITNELVYTARLSWVAALLSVVLGMLILRLLLYKSSPVISWCSAAGVTAASAAILRLGLMQGGFVTAAPDLHPFSMQGFETAAYLGFLASGAAAGLLLALLEPSNTIARMTGLLGVAIGVLYHLRIATTWLATQPATKIPLVAGEFLAPAIFGFLLARIFKRGGFR